MENITLSKLTPEDIIQFNDWEKYRATEGYKDIKRYILDESDSSRISNLVKTYHDKYPIGRDELNQVIVAKNFLGNIVGFAICDMFDISKNNPLLYLHFLAIHPTYQKQGIAKQIVYELARNIEDKKFFRVEPKCIFANIDKSNENSQKLFSKLGFDKKRIFTESLQYQQYTIDFEKLLELAKVSQPS